MNNVSIQKLIKLQKNLMIIGIIIVIFGLFGGGIINYIITTKKYTNLSEVTKSGVSSAVDVELVTDYFATLTTNFAEEKYYFITDADYTYIAKLDDETFARLKENYDYNYSLNSEEIPPESVSIFGVSEEIPLDIQNFAISYFQKSEGIDLNADNFSDVIYPYLINSNITKTDMIINNAVIFGIVTVIGTILLMICVNVQNKGQKSINNYSNSLAEIENELNAKNSIYYKSLKTYLTDNYLINYRLSLKIIALDDIVWLYQFERHQSGLVVNRNIVVITKNGQKNFIGKVNGWNKRKEGIYNDLYHRLLEKTPNALHGYSKNNKDEIQQLLCRKESK